MEDLIDIISKKKQSRKDLEKLKSEKAKNKVFMESLKKINKQEAQQPISCSVDVQDVSLQPRNINITHKVVEVKETKATSPTPAYGPQHSPYMLNSHLPDLVNHEKYFRKQDNPESQSTLGHLGNLNPSQEYLNHLQKLQEPSQMYDNQGLPIQEKTIPLIDNQIINKQYSKSR